MPNGKQGKRISLIATNQLLIEACVFARNILIARLIGAETLGQFIFLVLSIRLFAMSTDLAVERYVLQTCQSKIRQALGSAHFINVCRGVVLALVLLLMGLHQIQGIDFTAYAALAASAIVRGYTHQGYVLKQRSLNFKPALYVEGLSALVGLAGMYFVLSVAPSLEAACACLVAQALLHTGLSHALSDEKFQSIANWVEFRQIVKFGCPLMLSGVTMFWSMQGERLFLSSALPADAFAHFSMMFQLALVPILVISRMALSYGLPLLSGLKSNFQDFQTHLNEFHRWIYAIGSIYAFLFVLSADFLLRNLFGDDFRADAGLVLLVAIAQMIRLYRAPQSVAAQALGHTDIPFKANLVRVSFVLLAIAVIMNGGSLFAVLLLACIGEGLAWATQGILFSLRLRKGFPSLNPQLATQEIA